MAYSIHRRQLTRNLARGIVTTTVHTLAITKGQVLYVEGLVGSTIKEDTLEEERLAEVEELEDGHKLLIFNRDALVSAEELHPNLMTCKHARFGRDNRPRVQSGHARRGEDREVRRGRTFHYTVKPWRLLLAAILQARVPMIHVPGGLQYAIAFCDDQNGRGGEMIIGAPYKKVEYEHNGEITAGCIVSKHHIQPLLAGLLPREQNEEQQERRVIPEESRHRYPEYSDRR